MYRKPKATFLSLLASLSFSNVLLAQFNMEMTDPGITDESFAAEVMADEKTSRAAEYLAITGHGMLEQGFTLQHTSLENAAGIKGGGGFELGIRLDSFPLADSPENLIGKQENTKFSPALPRFRAGYSHRGERFDWSLGYSIVPPISVQGASAMIMGADLSVAYALSEHLRLGIETDLTTGQALAPVTATPEQYEAGELSNVDEERYQAVCAPQEYGCIDALNLRHGGLRLAASFPVSKTIHPFIKVGAHYIYETFDVQSDLSSYRLEGWLPNLATGSAFTFSDKLKAGVGLSLAPLPSILDDGRSTLLMRIEAGLSYLL